MLERINSPADLQRVPADEIPALAAEIRSFLVDKVSATGGHLGPNLGVVELTLALHRTFDSPSDVILWDTGHQAYVHKILTGRSSQFDTLRQAGGISGYPSRTESPHDVIENSHASTALSYADGIAKAWEQRGLLDSRHVVAVIGDGALTGGMAWEALNNIAGSSRPVVIVVNDNERSYAPTIGGVAHHLSTLRTTGGYERFLTWGKRVLRKTPVVGAPVYETLHGMKKGLKDIVAPQGMFEDLGLKYIGPVDGHDVEEIEHALTRAKGFPGPVIVHCLTEKGRGYRPAEEDQADRFHGVGIIDPDTGKPLSLSGPTWTGAFSNELVAIGHRNPSVVAITAAMLGPTGLDQFAAEFPSRVFDVGIAEQHAAASAAGLAFGGAHPVVAVYATFLNRAFDQVLMDCALHNAGVTFILDRAGVTGDDGASHNGVWDLALMAIVPGISVAAPRDGATLREALREAVQVNDAPTVIRFPKGAINNDIPAIERRGRTDVLRSDPNARVLLVGVGAMVTPCLEAAKILQAQGISSTVVDPRWVLPVSSELVEIAGTHSLVVVVEDGVRAGGVAGAITRALVDARINVPVQDIAVPLEFLEHAKRQAILEQVGLTPDGIAATITAWTTSHEV